MLSAETVAECTLSRLALLPVSLNLATSWKNALFVSRSTLGKSSSNVSFNMAYDYVWKQCSRIKICSACSKIIFVFCTNSLPQNARTWFVLQFDCSVMLYWYVPTYLYCVLIHSITSLLRQSSLIMGRIFCGPPCTLRKDETFF